VKHGFIDLLANGATQDWGVEGGIAAWQACLRGSGDDTYIYDGTTGHISTFDCQAAQGQQEGFVSGLVLRVRARTTSMPFGPWGIQLDCSVDFGAGPVLAISFHPTDTNWTDLQYRWSWDGAARLTTAGLAALQAHLLVQAGFPGGLEHFQISEMWLEVEYCDTLEYYDPITFAQIPSTMAPFYLYWSALGTAAAAIDGATGMLLLTDASAVDYRRFYRDASFK